MFIGDMNTFTLYIGTKAFVFVFCLFSVSHHGNILSRILQFIFDTTGDVSEVGQRELFKLNGPQNAGVRLKHLQSLNNTQRKEEERREFCFSHSDKSHPQHHYLFVTIANTFQKYRGAESKAQSSYTGLCCTCYS